MFKLNECQVCHQKSYLISRNLKVCGQCVIKFPEESKAFSCQAHSLSRKEFSLPPIPPRTSRGIKCHLCVNECLIGVGEKGFCGLRVNKNGKLHHLGGTSSKGILTWYYDPLPTNCVGDWVCPGGTGSGYPQYAYRKGPEYGYKNLAVFFGACTFNCLFCQNWHFKKLTQKLKPTFTAPDFAQFVDDNTSCICFFGGDPTPQLPFAIKASEIALEKKANRILRICWETNGSMNKKLLKKVAKLSLSSGGCVKFDLKAFDENLHIALTGVSNKRTLENFSELASYIPQRPSPPFLIASTLLVPGYIDAKEIRKIAKFIAHLDPNIPYSLLAFFPQFKMSDLPTTSRSQAQECYQVAFEAGLKRVKIGNVHLLS